MKRRVAIAVVLAALAFLAGAWAMLELVDRLLGGTNLAIRFDLGDDEPGGGWDR